MKTVWLIFSSTDSNDPSPSLLGAWSTQDAAEAEAERLKAHPRMGRYIIEVEEVPIDQRWED